MKNHKNLKDIIKDFNNLMDKKYSNPLIENKITCGCINVEIQEYGNQVYLKIPNNVTININNTEKTIREGVDIDVCLAGEILELWRNGIRTTGCCCGHNKIFAYIGIYEEDIEKMLRLGYIIQPNKHNKTRKDNFYPKTLYPKLYIIRFMTETRKELIELYGFRVGDIIKVCDNEFKTGPGKVAVVSNMIGEVGKIVSIRQRKPLKILEKETKSRYIKREKIDIENNFCFKILFSDGHTVFFSKKEIIRLRFYLDY